MLPNSGSVDVLPTLPVPVHALSPIHSRPPLPLQPSNRDGGSAELSRSASFTYLSRATATAPVERIKRTFSENILAVPTEQNLNPAAFAGSKELFRRASKNAKNRTSQAKFTLPSDDKEISAMEKSGKMDNEPMERAKALGRSVTGTIRGLARKSWIPTPSKSVSPPRPDNAKVEKKHSGSPTKKQNLLSPQIITVPPAVASRSSSRSSNGEEDESSYPEVSRAPRQAPPVGSSAASSTTLDVGENNDQDLRISRTPSSISLRSKRSFEKLTAKFPSMKAPPIPKMISSDRLSAASVESQKKRDPLWGMFRSLEGDFVTFQSKSSLQKAKVVRANLLPFLSKYAEHPSNRALRAEDLDRRVMVLNKWWLGLLETLNGRNNQGISATDRPAFLEGISGIMMRPEWRIPSLSITLGTETPQPSAIPKSKSTYSLESSESDFLVESIHHNVRNLFVQNLLSQMAFVVERMSMRTTPASLVSFCGKACAYAFFFCPGIADILVRLWRIPVGTLRRVFAEAKIGSDFDFRSTTQSLSSNFPAPLRSLSITSQAALGRHMQLRIPPPAAASHIRWFGPWTGRWSGRDSDLFFTFTKFYHILVAEHLPPNTPKESFICIPGVVPIHAQVLTVLEITLYRHAGQSHVDKFATGTFEKRDSPDATLPLPLTIANAARSMAENRLIMLLRDLLANTSTEHQLLRDLYVPSFDKIVKAAAKRISMYNNDACFVLCDFMEEFLPLMSRYHQMHVDTPVLDWSFWLKVCQRMMDSQNTLTQVRLITFLYTTWDILTADETRKEELVLAWLLEPAFFELHFSHWCPMVRHYFHRLICWRVARYDGEASEIDTKIYETMATQMNNLWAYHQYLRAEAEMRDIAAPSSAPCTPAPSRRLLIVRTDSQPLPAAVFAALDNLTKATNQSSPYQNHSSALNNIPPADSPSQNKKRWSILRSIIPFNTTPGNNRPGEVTPPIITEEPTFPGDLESDGSVGRVQPDKAHKLAELQPPTPPHRALSFKFSLEWLDRPSWPSRDRQLISPQLPQPAQTLLQLHRGETPPADTKPRKPVEKSLASAKYAGRALAEWAQVVSECQGFFERRREEGVPSDRLVETPALGVESFRMSG